MATLSRFDTELKELDRVIKEKKGTINQLDLDLSKLQHEITILNKEKTTATNAVSKLEQQHEWIQEEKQWVSVIFSCRNLRDFAISSLFNRPGTQYDFTVDISSLKQKCDELETAQKGMKKKINPKVMNMIDR
jgi:structural maintenance of chromosome 2